jgi:protein-S-isoprenylcysteine O-methyltransferase Ste14
MDWPAWLRLARYAIGVVIAISVPPAIVYWFIIHPFIAFWRRVGMKPTLWLLGVFMIGSMAALYPFRDALLGRDLGTSWPAILLAVPLIVTAAVISRKRRRHLPFRILSGLPELSPEKHGIGLLTEGIYGHLRHPRYVEFTLALTGWSLFANYLGLYVITALCVAAIYLVVLVEERELRERYGQAYADYSARVPRFVPRWR